MNNKHMNSVYMIYEPVPLNSPDGALGTLNPEEESIP